VAERRKCFSTTSSPSVLVPLLGGRGQVTPGQATAPRSDSWVLGRRWNPGRHCRLPPA
jgi:hypothetical protein